ncbi:DEAD/DEAH box helicase [Acetobacter cibinongensis]|uniref:Damage-inducible protein n=1 Tax=Acetobacter cibinongensis TaxID=146475 RepID=A0A1Z5YS27_9PROT|nr:type ISP restriction/modification enzyme [Acetobacter cibinongensis]OUJ00557.1 damage-inducible protein [Acetobacter cibinongensis]
MSALSTLLDTFRYMAVTESEKGTYFEELIVCYLRTEPSYADLYDMVWPYKVWAGENGYPVKDTGIDLVARERGTGKLHAIQCKFYAPDHKITKKDIDTFFSASGKSWFSHRVIVATTNLWNSNAKATLADQHPPVSKIDLLDLETSVIDWSQYQPRQAPVLREKKTLREHQDTAVKNVLAGFRTADRGRLIMACGTGKTFTSLKLAEQQVGAGGRVLFLVPSLSLLSQSLTEWTQESQVPLHSFAVCSDSDVGKKKASQDDEIKVKIHELRYPATTNPERLASEYQKRHDATHMTVVFSTYHSIDVISQAQKEFGFPEFDLIVCDEAHRTTGVTFGGEENDSAFVRVHNQTYLQGQKRLYMTATPRIYGDVAKEKAENEGAIVYGMNNAEIFGPEFHVITFSEAVRRKLLVDYKVIVLAVDEGTVSARLQKLLDDPDNGLKVDDAAKIVGCWKALAKVGLSQNGIDDPDPMKRAVAFCQVISADYKGRAHKVSSVQIADMFQKVVEEYQKQDGIEEDARLICEAEHVDGGMNASEKEGKLQWLKAETPDNTCRVLSNVRCLSEGVDVPALDAVLFLTPRNSQVDVVQSVGRVMRNAPGKKRGYVVLPVVIPAGTAAEQSLDNNQAYKVVWQVLQALRSHDDRFDSMVNKMDLQAKPDTSRMEVIAVTKKIVPKTKALTSGTAQQAHSSYSIGQKVKRPEAEQFALQYEVGEIERAIYAKIVKKVGNRHHWEDWAGDVAKIAQTHITRIRTILDNPENVQAREAFEQFSTDLRSELNNSISRDEIIEMLAQHLITQPVFEALFSGHSFVSDNPMSKAMQSVLAALEKHSLHKEADTLEAFYQQVRERASGIDTAYGRQKVIKELYDGFFQQAFPRLKERLGIVYTPLEVVDFIIRSVADVLRDEFGQTPGSEGVHIMDPFTGTGTFITRLLQSGLISKEQMLHKFRHELHANEIVLLAYYIASINIEATFSDLMDGVYEPFEGICLTDTFRLSEPHDLIGRTLEENNKRIKKQKKLDIRVIIGNPPYSVGQASGNDNNQNVAYPALDARIAETYAERSTATNKRALYDSYIRALRWASDRIGDCGVLGFVTNAGFLDANTADGLRQCLADEFSTLYVFHLRGGIRGKSGDFAKKEGGNIFDIMVAPAISILVKNPEGKEQGRILFYDIGDYLTREQKLKRIEELSSIDGLTKAGLWKNITPDRHGDWLRQRDDSFGQFIAIGSKDKEAGLVLFSDYSSGVKTQRDSWCYNSSHKELADNVQRMTSFYNAELERFNQVFAPGERKEREKNIDNFINTDPQKISWSAGLKQDLVRNKSIHFDDKCIVKAVYRPFTRQWLYYNRSLNERVYQMPRLFPDAQADNLVICMNGMGSRNGTTVWITNAIIDLNAFDAGSQCFPLYVYSEKKEEKSGKDDDLFASGTQAEPVRQHGITDEGLAHFQTAYPGHSISKDDIFYYVYGLLHSPDYRERYADTLRKELPRIPRVKGFEAFKRFSEAGRQLGALHVHFDSQPIYAGVEVETGGKKLSDDEYRVEQMKYGKGKDKTLLHYNERITIKNIPLEAYEYVVNGKPALDWVVERQCVKTDKASGIVNDANDWAAETMHNPRYPLELFLRVITVSLETMKIVNALPSLEILDI